jgi:hypothetical protein
MLFLRVRDRKVRAQTLEEKDGAVTESQTGPEDRLTHGEMTR